MNGKQILRVLELLNIPVKNNIFKGIFLSNEIPNFEKNSVFIVNTYPDNQNMYHWVTFYVQDENNIEFFDSLGNSPELYGGGIQEFASKFLNKNFNPFCFQGKSSNVCGGYAINYVICKYKGQSFESIITEMVNEKVNDEWIFQSLKPLLKNERLYYTISEGTTLKVISNKCELPLALECFITFAIVLLYCLLYLLSSYNIQHYRKDDGEHFQISERPFCSRNLCDFNSCG